MCGIIGFVNCKMEGDYIDAFRYRGPDDSGTQRYKNVELSHLRLSILDTSASGHQPMILKERGLSIIFNGEIYNHMDLRKELKKGGYTFHSASDTETLLKGWDHWGEDILAKLNGIFAFAILDKKQEELFLVRDNFGIKPLYIYQKGNKLAFASELKIFNSIAGFDDVIDPITFSKYLSFLWSPGRKTPYRHVTKLLPGHLMRISLKKVSHAAQKKYYSLPFEGDYLPADEEAIIDQLDKHLKQAVERQLLADVPLGFFLSGGLDSSLIVSMARSLHPDRHFDCFTIASNMDQEGKGFEDDAPYARQVADYLNVDLHMMDAPVDIAQRFDDMIWHLDEPQADPAPLNVFNIALGARNRGIKVLLGGTAGDDLFSGYRRHQAFQFDQLIDYIPAKLRSTAKAGIHKLPSKMAAIRKIQKLSRDWEKPMQQRMLGYFNWLPTDDYVYQLFNDAVLNSGSKNGLYSYFLEQIDDQSPSLSALDTLLDLEIKTFLVDHNLNYTDKMSMAASVETRVPFLDKDLVAFAGKIPSELKLKGGETKYILKKVAERYLPKEVVYRSKTGFGAPVRKWLKNELKPMVHQRLNYSFIKEQNIFNPDAIQRMIEQNDADRFDFSYPILSMLAIQSWLDQFSWSL